MLAVTQRAQCATAVLHHAHAPVPELTWPSKHGTQLPATRPYPAAPTPETHRVHVLPSLQARQWDSQLWQLTPSVEYWCEKHATQAPLDTRWFASHAVHVFASLHTLQLAGQAWHVTPFVDTKPTPHATHAPPTILANLDLRGRYAARRSAG